jgi:hypothetical protein
MIICMYITIQISLHWQHGALPHLKIPLSLFTIDPRYVIIILFIFIFTYTHKYLYVFNYWHVFAYVHLIYSSIPRLKIPLSLFTIDAIYWFAYVLVYIYVYDCILQHICFCIVNMMYYPIYIILIHIYP